MLQKCIAQPTWRLAVIIVVFLVAAGIAVIWLLPMILAPADGDRLPVETAGPAGNAIIQTSIAELRLISVEYALENDLFDQVLPDSKTLLIRLERTDGESFLSADMETLCSGALLRTSDGKEYSGVECRVASERHDRILIMGFMVPRSLQAVRLLFADAVWVDLSPLDETFR